MKAAVFHQLGKPLAIEDVDLAEPRAREVRVRIVASGLCHSDIHRLHGESPSALPMVMGHEGAGVVEAIGPGVTAVVPGDHVIISFGPYCGECAQCGAGNFSRCAIRRTTAPAGNLLDGTSRLSLRGQRISHQSSVSSFAEYAVVHESSAIPIPKQAPLDVMALLGCGATSGLAPVFNDAQVQAGSRVAVFGCGGLGMNAIQAAALSGAEIVIGVDLLEHRLKMAQEFGATHTVNPGKSDAVEEIRRIARGGVDYAFEFVGSPKAALQALDACDSPGKAFVCGVMPQDLELPVPWWRVMMRGVSLKASGFGAARPKADIPKYVNLYLAGKLKFDPLVTGRFKLAEIDKAIDTMERGEGLRNLVYPN